MDFETKSRYSVTVTVDDQKQGTDTITVAISVTNVNETRVNNAPEFTEGASTNRTIVENTAPNTNIGNPIYAIDDDSNQLRYTLGGTDVASFRIDPNSGQLKTYAALDFETKSQYSVIVTVSDNLLTDSIVVTINVTNENDSPIFADGTDTTRSIGEHAGTGVNIGQPVSATDDDDSSLSYLLNGTDQADFSIDSSSGQLRTKEPLNFETKALYAVIITATDNRGGTTSIAVEIRITNENDVPVFTETGSVSRTIPENTVANTNIGTPVSATDEDDDSLTYSLGGVDALTFDIDNTNGQIKTKEALDYETKLLYSVEVSVNDSNGGIVKVAVTINVSDANDAPVFSDGDSTTRSVAENAVADTNIGSPVSATDQDEDDLTYSLGGTDVASFDIDTNTGQLKTKAALDFDDKSVYSVSVSVVDNESGMDTIAVRIEVTEVTVGNNAPTFTDGAMTTRSIAENSPADTDVGTPVAATDADSNTLEYTLGGTDASSFDIDDTSGQIKTKAALDFETKSRYSVTVSVTDNRGGSDSIDVTITVSDVNDAPIFTDGASTTRSVAENTVANTNIGTPVAATDQDDTTLNYSLGGADAASFDIDNGTGQIKTKSALDFEDTPSYSVSVSVTDNRGGSDSIDVTITVSDVNDAPIFTDGASTTRSVAENTVANTNIGTPVAATDQDDSTLNYSLGGADAASFDIDNGTGQIKTKSALDFENKPSYSVIITVRDDDNASDTIAVTITVSDVNEAPAFDDVGGSTTRSIAENSVADTDIGTPVSATDPENNNLTYTLGGTDANAFDIDNSTGQIKTKDSLDFETKSSYSVIVSVTDNTNSSVSITVTINIIDIELEMSVVTGRTQAVIDAIIEAIADPNITAADQITDAHLAAITTLDLQSKELTTLQADDFAGLTSLETLYLQNNQLVSFPEDIFDELSSLTTLDLSGNEIDSIPINFFDDLTTLTNLNLSANNLQSLPNSILDKLTSLICLDLSSNRLESLLMNIFDNLTSLEKLDLSSNEFTTFVLGLFDALTALTDLNISDNAFTSLPSDIFDGLTSLTSLDMSSTNYTSYPSDIFEGLTSLLSLNLADNGLTGLPSVASDITTLTTLNLSDNTLTLTVGMFDDLTALTELILSNIGISSIPSGFFSSITQLISIDLSENPITSLPGGPFSALSSLENLNLHNNLLTSIPDGLFVGLTALKSLDLITLDPLSFLRVIPILEKVEDGKVKAVVKSGAPYTITVEIHIIGGATDDFEQILTIPLGSTDSETFTLVREPAADGNAVSVRIDHVSFKGLNRRGIGLDYSRDPIEILPAVSMAPVLISDKPIDTQVLVNYPNPFNPETWIPFQLAKPTDVSLIFYNVKGEAVRELELGRLAAGYYKSRSRAAYWDGRNKVGEKVSAGIYFCRFKAGEYSVMRKMLILK